jgi:plasmid stabilization system protein ParE
MKEKKIDRLLVYIRSDDWSRALSLAASFPRLGEERTAIVRAHEVLAHPGFYAQLGRDEDQILREGIAALRSRYASRITA